MLTWDSDFEAEEASGEFWAQVSTDPKFVEMFVNAFNRRLRVVSSNPANLMLLPAVGALPLQASVGGFWFSLAHRIQTLLLPYYLRTIEDDGETPVEFDGRAFLESWQWMRDDVGEMTRDEEFAFQPGLAGTGSAFIPPIFPPPNARRPRPRDIATLSETGDEREVVRFVRTEATPEDELEHNGKFFQRTEGEWVWRSTLTMFLRRKWRRTIAATTDPGEEGWVARLVAAGTTPAEERAFSGRNFRYTSGAWQREPSRAVDPDYIEDWGLPQPGDTFGPWIATDLRDAIAALTATAGVTPWFVSSGGAVSFAWTLANPSFTTSPGPGPESIVKHGAGSSPAAAYADFDHVSPIGESYHELVFTGQNFRVFRSNGYISTVDFLGASAPLNPDGLNRRVEFYLRSKKMTLARLGIGGEPTSNVFDDYGDEVIENRWHRFDRMTIESTDAVELTSTTAWGEETDAPEPFASGGDYPLRGWQVEVGGTAAVLHWDFNDAGEEED